MLEHDKIGREEEGTLFGLSEPKDVEFMKMYLGYMAQLKFDDFYHWTTEEYDYLMKQGFHLKILTPRYLYY